MPEEDIEAVFQRSYENLIGHKDPILLSVDGKRQQIVTLETIFNDYKYYFESFWLGVVKPARISVFNQPKCTSNDIERYHRAWGTYVGIKPTSTVFISKLTNLIIKYSFFISDNMSTYNILI